MKRWQRVVLEEPQPEDNLVQPQGISSMKIDEPDPDDQELRRNQDSVTVVCSLLHKSIEILQAEVNPMEATGVLQTLFQITRNVIEHPDELKYKRLRKANRIIQRNVANYKAAMEILYLDGFNEDVVLDEIRKTETYLVLKRNDPGLLWLAKSSLETCIALAVKRSCTELLREGVQFVYPKLYHTSERKCVQDVNVGFLYSMRHP